MPLATPPISSSPIERAIEEAAWTVVEQTYGKDTAAAVRFYVPPELLVREPNVGVERMATLLGVHSLPLHTRIAQCFRGLVGLPTAEGDGATLGDVVAQARRHFLTHLFQGGTTRPQEGMQGVGTLGRP